jgi:hypothetical protein
VTLILTAVTADCVIMASDRRLSSRGKTTTDDAGKAGFVKADDGVALWAYTGLAQLGSFNASGWIGDAFLAAKSTKLNEVLFQFAELAEDKFKKLQYKGYGISLAVAGFQRDIGQFMGEVTNFIFDDALGDYTPSAKFRTEVMISPNEAPRSLSGVMASGYNQIKYGAELESLNTLVLRGAPAAAIESKAVQTIRTLADDRRTAGTVGKNVMTAILKASQSNGSTGIPAASYWPIGESQQLYLLDMVDIRSEFPVALRDIQLVFAEGERIGPRLGRNERCHCGSGLKFKYCHGRSSPP